MEGGYAECVPKMQITKYAHVPSCWFGPRLVDPAVPFSAKESKKKKLTIAIKVVPGNDIKN
jgi:glycerol uptake facilitator-like aquaporin